MLSNDCKRSLMEENTDLVKFQRANGMWDFKEGGDIRTAIESTGKLLQIFEALRISDRISQELEIRTFILLEHYENRFVHEMGYDVRTHHTTWMRTNDVLDWLVVYHNELGDKCIHYLKMRAEELGLEVGETTDKQIHDMICDFVLDI